MRTLLLAVLCVSALVPLLLLIVTSIGAAWRFPDLLPSGTTGTAWLAAATGGRLLEALAASVIVAIGASALAVLVALPAGRALADLHGWARHAGAAAAFLPVAAPPIALATGLQYSFLRLGLGGTEAGVALAHAIPAAGYATLWFLGVFSAFDRRLEDEARSLGATPGQVLMRVTLPALRRPVAEAFALGCLVSWAQVPLTLLIGGGAVRTLPVEVLGFVQAGQDRFAAVGSLLLVAPALALLGIVAFGVRRTEAVPL